MAMENGRELGALDSMVTLLLYVTRAIDDRGNVHSSATDHELTRLHGSPSAQITLVIHARKDVTYCALVRH